MSDNGKFKKIKKKSINRNKIIPKAACENVPDTGLASRQDLQKITLERHLGLHQITHRPTSSTSQYFVLPAGGMHFAVPDLNFKADHFEEGSSMCKGHWAEECSRNSCHALANNVTEVLPDSYVKPIPDSLKRQQMEKERKLPYAVELTAGPGISQNKDGSSKKGLLPSETLLATASIIKSYFMEGGDKSDSDDETVKDKVLGVWNSVKYGWSANFKTNFSRETRIYLLGKVYHKSFKEDQAYDGLGGCTASNMEGFKQDFKSIAWFTYRKKFICLPESTFTSDCGWGCMIRSGQMMMAAALSRHFLSPGWRYNGSEDGPQASIHRQIMKWFCDVPLRQCPFSLHNLILAGHKMNKKAGNWYGPSCVSHMFKDVLSDAPKSIPALESMTVYVAQDGAVYIQDVLDLCSTGKCICHMSDSQTLAANKLLGESFKRTRAISVNADTSDLGSLQSVASLSSSWCIEPYSEINNDKLCHNSHSDVEIDSSLSSFCKIDHVPQAEENKFPIDLFVNSNRELYNRIGVGMALNPSSASESKVSEDEICDFCQGWKSCLILIPVRLGGSTVNPIYYDVIYSLFAHDLCVGIIGGRPKHSLYFVGFQEDSLIHLDPHYNQDAVEFDDPDFPLSSFHCSSPKKISISKMDPSATIGFYCHTQSQFFRLIQQAKQIATAKDGSLDSPIFEFVDGKSLDVNGWLDRALSEETEQISISTSQPESIEDSEVLILD